MVPPPHHGKLWNALERVRTQLKDPGLYRWPPHVNLLYPFVDAYSPSYSDPPPDAPDSGMGRDLAGAPSSSRIVDREVVAKLMLACQQVQPFVVQVKHLGTFGGSKRGVLWLDPRYRPMQNDKSHERGDNVDDPISPPASPLIHLQHLLEHEFPHCTNQRLTGGNSGYRPHMTLSHFLNLEAAQAARAQLQSGCDAGAGGDIAGWHAMSDSDVEFLVDRIYVLTRMGDDGQFERVAEIPLGAAPTDNAEGSSVCVHCYEPEPARFPGMPRQEADWIREERMALKRRRNGSSRRRRRRRIPSQRGDDVSSPASPAAYARGKGHLVQDTPEVVARKRVERRAKREALTARARDSDGLAGKN